MRRPGPTATGSRTQQGRSPSRATTGSIRVVADEAQEKQPAPTVLIVVGLLAAGVLLGGIALALGGDRLVDCGSLRGLDALMGDNVNHVDGPADGGGCIVPTTAAWTTAVVAAVAPLVIWLLARRSAQRA